MPAQKERDESARQFGLDLPEGGSSGQGHREREKMEQLGIQPATTRPEAAIRGERIQQRSSIAALLTRLRRMLRGLIR